MTELFTPIDRPVIWHVCFHPGRRWWGRRFTHVSLAGYFEDTWVHFDLQRGGVRAAAIYRHEDVDDYLSFLLTHYAVVRVSKAPFDGDHFLRPMTCVSFVKHVLGVSSGALRPDSLFRDLLRDFDGEWINEDAENRGEP